MVFLLCAQGCVMHAAKIQPHEPAFKGTFFQLLSPHKEWKDADWEKMFSYFQALKISIVIVQWTAIDGVEFFGGQNGNDPSPLEVILARADRAGMKVLVGLAQDSSYWEKVQGDVASVEAYLARAAVVSKSLAGRLAPVVERHPSFQGWYITQEIDDVNWITPRAQEILFEHLSSLTEYLQDMFPDKPVAISGFCNANLTPGAFERFWGRLLKAVPVDIVMFQDGIGVRKLSLINLPLYLEAVHRAVDADSCELAVIVEIFEVEGDSSSGLAFKAQSAPWRRIRRQMAVDAVYGSDLIAFSIPEYMMPGGGPRAEKLFREYLRSRRP